MVVFSLVILSHPIIDRPNHPPFLFARTAEIFGVVEVVVSSRRLVESKEFQNLSVTSEKWLKITEVQPKNLKSFLENLRMKRGYSVGEYICRARFGVTDSLTDWQKCLDVGWS